MSGRGPTSPDPHRGRGTPPEGPYILLAPRQPTRELADVNTLTVELGSRSYPILIGAGLLSRADVLARHVPGRDILLVSNTIVAPLYAAALKEGPDAAACRWLCRLP